MLKRLKGKVALVTGSGRGFGRTVAIAYAIEGAKVIAISRTVSELEGLEKIIQNKGGDILIIPTDLSKDEDIYRVRDKINDDFGRLDILVNNAATNPWKTFDKITIKDWDHSFAVNLRAPFVLSKLFFDSMKKQGGGSIINVTSGSAQYGFVAEMAYCPSKYGIEGLTQCLALELKPYNIAVNTLGVSAPPGKTLKPTELTLEEAKKMPKDIRDTYADDEPMIESFIDAWVFLALQDASGVTGQRLYTNKLADYIKRNGWEAAIENWKGKLTKAVYVSYDFPKSVRYQTRDGKWKELKFD